MNLRTIALVCVSLTGDFCVSPARAQFSAFAHVTRANQKDYNVGVRVLPVDAEGKQCRVVVSGIYDGQRAYLIVGRTPLSPDEQNFRAFFWHEGRSRDDVLSVSPLPLRPTLKSVYNQYLECVVDTSRFATSYIYVDYPHSVADGGYYYSIDLATFLPPDVPQATIQYSPAQGLGPEPGVMRRDPSDIIRTREYWHQRNQLKTRDTYYVWYTKSYVSHGYDATIWYATSNDGQVWTEQGEALPRGAEGQWDAQSVFTPNILKVRDKYYLFYTGVPKPFHNEGNEVTKSAIGVAVADGPGGPWQKLADNPILVCSEDPVHFDSMRVDDACLLVRGGKYWLYYKGRQWNNTPAHTMMGVALAERPEGPYTKIGSDPVVRGGHEVLVWPWGTGVAALINIGPEGIGRTLQYAPDGLTFFRVLDMETVPHAPGVFRVKRFREVEDGPMIAWGLHIGQKEGHLPFLERFDCQWQSADGRKGPERSN